MKKLFVIGLSGTEEIQRLSKSYFKDKDYKILYPHAYSDDLFRAELSKCKSVILFGMNDDNYSFAIVASLDQYDLDNVILVFSKQPEWLTLKFLKQFNYNLGIAQIFSRSQDPELFEMMLIFLPYFSGEVLI